jgi:hypothetical protein
MTWFTIAGHSTAFQTQILSALLDFFIVELTLDSHLTRPDNFVLHHIFLVVDFTFYLGSEYSMPKLDKNNQKIIKRTAEHI